MAETLTIPADLFDADRPPHALQRAAVETAATSGISVVTGGPGVGKTFTVNSILRLFQANNLSVALAAPTGKAAVRMTEQTGFPASTIHRLLGWTPSGWRFNASEPVAYDNEGEQIQGPLPFDAIILDEVSMVDVELLSGALAAVDTSRTRVVLVGDVDQLPSIGAGRVLHDLIESGVVPTTRLTHIFRQADESRIPYVARDINEGRLPAVAELNARTHGSDVVWREVSDVEALQHAIVESVVRLIPQRRGIAPEDVQVLCPQHQKGLGDEDLNPLLQRELNPCWAEKGGLGVARNYRVFTGDRVLHANRNNYDLGVANGETGKVVEANFKGVEADADVHVSGKGKVVAVVDFGDRRVGYSLTEAQDHLELAYAMTVHKSQGSQFKAVVVPVHSCNEFMLTRPLLYTAITRAESFLLMMGEEGALQKAAGNRRGVERRTTLQSCLSDCAA